MKIPQGEYLRFTMANTGYPVVAKIQNSQPCQPPKPLDCCNFVPRQVESVKALWKGSRIDLNCKRTPELVITGKIIVIVQIISLWL